MKKNNNKFLFGENYSNQRLNENGRCSNNKNHVLENPEFRFSDSGGNNDKKQIKRNGYLLADSYGFCNGAIDGNRQTGDNSSFTNEVMTSPQITGIFKNTQSLTNSSNDAN